jgi:hypothetical protein
MVVLATGIYFHTEIVKMVANFESNPAFSYSFGAHYLPDLIAENVDATMHPGPAVLGLVKLATFAVLFLAMAGWVVHMVRWGDFRAAVTRLPKPEKMFLLIGAALIGGCYFAGSSTGYRGIHLLLTVPGLVAMARLEGVTGVRQLAVQECALVVALTWAGFFTWHGLFRQILGVLIGNVPATKLVHFLWLLSEIAWWQVATLFILILISSGSDWVATASTTMASSSPRRRTLVKLTAN